MRDFVTLSVHDIMLFRHIKSLDQIKFFFKNWVQKYDSSIFGRRVSGTTPVFRNPEMSGWADTSTSAAIQSEICRFESVHPNIYAVYELLQEKD